MPWPSLSKAYCCTLNVATTDNSSTVNIDKNLVWMLKAALMNQLGAPTTGTRHVNSVWTCYGSSNGTTAAMDGVDRWGSTFSAASLVQGSSNNVPHSWIVLQNTTLGVQLLFDLLNNTFTSAGRIAFTPITTPFTVAATATHSPPITGQSVSYEQNNDSVSTSGVYWNFHLSTSTATGHRASFTFDDDGEFYFLMHRKGLRYFTGSMCGIRPAGGPATPLISTSFALWGDGVNGTSTTLKGWPQSQSNGRGGLTTRSAFGTLQGSASSFLDIGNVAAPTARYDSCDQYRNKIADVRPGTVYYTPVLVWDNSPSVAYRGVVPDVYHVTGGGTGISFPNVASQTHIGAGFYAIPLQGGVPIMG